MLAMFQLTFTIGEDLLGELAEQAIELLGGLIGGGLVAINAPPAWLISFISEGVIGGLGAVVEFIPPDRHFVYADGGAFGRQRLYGPGSLRYG